VSICPDDADSYFDYDPLAGPSNTGYTAGMDSSRLNAYENSMYSRTMTSISAYFPRINMWLSSPELTCTPFPVHNSQGSSPPMQHIGKMSGSTPDFPNQLQDDEYPTPNGLRMSGSVPAPGSQSQQSMSAPPTAATSQVSATQQDEATLKPWGLMGLTKVLKMSDKDLTVLSLGTDLTTLGLNLSSPEYVLQKDIHVLNLSGCCYLPHYSFVVYYTRRLPRPGRMLL
jgi:hypothetical protein